MSSDTLDASAVGTTVELEPHTLTEYPDNPRRGDTAKIAESLEENGMYAPIVVNLGTQTGRPLEVLAGNHTLRAFRQLGERDAFGTWSKIKAHIVDVDDEAAARIVIVDNRSHELGEGVDESTLRDLLHEYGTTGTGYTDADLDALDAAFAKHSEVEPDDDEDDEPPAPPNLNHREAAIGFTIVFDNEEQQTLWFDFLKLLAQDFPDDDLTVAERLVMHLDAA